MLFKPEYWSAGEKEREQENILKGLDFRVFAFFAANNMFNICVYLRSSVDLTESFTVSTQFLIRYSAERACATRPSPCARIEAHLPSSDAPCAEQPIRLERF